MKEERFPHTRKPLRGQRVRVAEGGASEPWRKAQQQGCGGQRGEIPAWRLGAEQHSPAREACLLTRQGGRGLGAEARIPGRGLGLAARTQPEGVSAPQLAGRESGKKSVAAEEARDFFLPLCFLVHEERGFRAPLKRAPETGVSCGYERGPHRRAGDAKAAAATTKKPVCEHRSLSTPPLPGACAARHGQRPVIQGQLPWENAQCLRLVQRQAGLCHRRLAPHPYPSLPPA